MLLSQIHLHSLALVPNTLRRYAGSYRKLFYLSCKL